MAERWYTLSNIKNISDQVTAEILVPADSAWFSGHFPGDPILPGIAQLSMAFDLVKKSYHEDRSSLQLISFKRIRFRDLIRPDELLSIIVNPVEKQKNSYSFKIFSGDKSACSGIMTVQ